MIISFRNNNTDKELYLYIVLISLKIHSNYQHDVQDFPKEESSEATHVNYKSNNVFWLPDMMQYDK